MILVYAITLGASAGITGLFVRQALGELGYVPGFTPGVMVACGGAATYAGLQMLYVGLVRFAWPTKTNGPLVFEYLSHGAALLFVAYFAHVNIVSAILRLFDFAGLLPHSEKNELRIFSLLLFLTQFNSLLYLGTFLAIHTALKLLGFYAILRSPPGPRIWNVAWIATAAPLLLAGFAMFEAWTSSVEKARPIAPEEVRSYRVGTAYANARALPEGSVLAVKATASIGNCLMFACANPPDIAPEDMLDVAYLTVEMRGDTTTQFTGPVELDEDAWSYIQVPADQLPRKMNSCQVRWSIAKESKWRRAVGVLPVLTSHRTLLVEGPAVREVPNDESTPNIVVIVVDGLGSDRVSSMGSARSTTPNLDRVAQSALTYPFVYTPAPESAAACMTLLTGVSPLRHGYLGEQRGPLPKDCKSLAEALRADRYATAAFTEGEMWGDMPQSSGFERGFELYDDGYTAEAPVAAVQTNQTSSTARAGSQETLGKAAKWIDAHKDVKYMEFVRLGELRDARAGERYGRALLPDPASATPSALYNAAIQYLDRNVGEFIARAKGAAPNNKLCVIVTSTRGSYLPEATVLADWSLRVPLILSVPGVIAAKRNELVALEDVPSTLAKLTHVTLSPYASTADLINAPVSREPISMAGNPLVLSIRDAKLRLVWSTQREPFTLRSAGLPAAASLYDLTRVRAGAPLQDVSSRNPDTTRKWTAKLEQYFATQSEGWQAATAK